MKNQKGCFGGTLPGKKKMAKKRDGKLFTSEKIDSTMGTKGTAGHGIYRKAVRAVIFANRRKFKAMMKARMAK